MTPRSYLFVPANRPERIDKALSSGADAVIVDLEDAVAHAEKDLAREALNRWLKQAAVQMPEGMPAACAEGRAEGRAQGRAEGRAQGNAEGRASEPGGGRPSGIVVRVNATEPWLEQDLELCAAHPLVRAVMIPKAESATVLMRLAHQCGNKSLIALIESAWGFENRREVAAVPAVRRLAFGSIDFQADTGISGEGDALLMVRSALVLASRLANLPPPVDGVSVAIEDETELMVESRWARQLGFGAKLCIHPKQVAVVNREFSPSQAELEWARRVVQASDAAGGAAVSVDGRMVDRPVVLRARALLAQAR